MARCWQGVGKDLARCWQGVGILKQFARLCQRYAKSARKGKENPAKEKPNNKNTYLCTIIDTDGMIVFVPPRKVESSVRNELRISLLPPQSVTDKAEP